MVERTLCGWFETDFFLIFFFFRFFSGLVEVIVIDQDILLQREGVVRLQISKDEFINPNTNIHQYFKDYLDLYMQSVTIDNKIQILVYH